MKKIIFTILCFFAITMVVGIACASDADNLTANETDLGEILTVDDNVNVTDLDVNDTVSVNNSSENNTEVIDANQTIKNNTSKLNITGPKFSNKYLDIKSPFPYNLRDNPTFKHYIDRWSNHFAGLLGYKSFNDAYSQLIHDYMWNFVMDDDVIYIDFKYNNGDSYVGVIFLVVNEHRSLKNQISFNKIEDDIYDAYNAWNNEDDDDDWDFNFF